MHRATLERRFRLLFGPHVRVLGARTTGAKRTSRLQTATTTVWPQWTRHSERFAIDNKAVQHSTVVRLICERLRDPGSYSRIKHIVTDIAWRKLLNSDRPATTGDVPLLPCTLEHTLSDVATVWNAQTRASPTRPFPIPSSSVPRNSHGFLFHLFPLHQGEQSV